MRRINRTGQRIGRLTVVSFSRSRQDVGDSGRKRLLWNCVCDCGNSTEIEGSNFYAGHTLSCGCLSREQQKEKAEKSGAAFSALLNEYKQSARKNGVVFFLSDNEFRKLTSSDCYYCGQKPEGIRWSASRRESYSFNGVDRKEGILGYSLDNCVSCCWDCNEMKSDRSHEEFLNKIEKIFYRRIKEVVDAS
jgi:hypothetical protein